MDFEVSDIFRVIALAFLELLLSSDNALVMAVLTHSLPEKQRPKALFIGVASAFVLRAIAILGVAYLIQFFWIQLLGGLYLIYLAARHLMKKRRHTTPSVKAFWKIVVLIELFDLAFAIDSIVAGIAFITPYSASKLWIVYVGGMIGLLGTRTAAHYFSILIQRFSRLETYAFLIVAWIGVKLALSTLGISIPGLLFWAVNLILFVLGFITSPRLKSKP